MPQPDLNVPWDPGGSRRGVCVPMHIYSLLCVASTATATNYDDDEESRTELDSHANMPVVGRHSMIVSKSGDTALVNAFSPDFKPLEIPIVDAALKYTCPFSGKEYALVIRNALYVPSMKTNLIPPFVMREAGIEVRDVPKIQLEEPTEKDHAMHFPETGFTIPMQLWGVFSYFVTTKPTSTFLQSTDNVYLLTPTQWDPHSDAYAQNETNMTDWEGNVLEVEQQPKLLLSEIDEDKSVSSLR